jgi:hypothetical protein
MLSSASPDSNPNLNFGRYELVREVGRGGMAVVYEARHGELGTRVALKVPLGTWAQGSVGHLRFRNEALYAARIRHPNVVQVHDYGTLRGAPYIAMEFLEGSPLSLVLACDGRLSAAVAVDTLLGVLAGVGAAHAAGITHRDLKPHNVFLARSPEGCVFPVVIDFGVAKGVFDDDGAPSDASLTTSGVTLGTAAYMAPEQILCARDVGPLADQYALGVTLYECLTGRLPFSASSSYESMHAALNTRPSAPSELRPELPPGLDEIVLRAISRDPAERFPSIHAMGAALLPFANEWAALAWRANVTKARWDGAGGASPPPPTSTVHDAHRRPARRSAPRPALFALTVTASCAVGAAMNAWVHPRTDAGARASSLVLPAPSASTVLAVAPPGPIESLATVPLEPPLAIEASAVPSTADPPRVAAPPPGAAAGKGTSSAPRRQVHAEGGASRGKNGAPILD